MNSYFFIFSYRKELCFVLSVFAGILLLPFFGVVIIAHTGIPAVSNHLATTDTANHTIALHDPVTGKVTVTIDTATMWPIKGIVTLEFGQSDLPYQPLHTGIDIAGKLNDPVTPFMAGKVIQTDTLTWGYGKHVAIDNGNNITSIYAHLNEIDTTVGAQVKPGDIIGKEGQTGWATGPHVHFEVRVFNVPVNPRTFVTGDP